jgi:ferrous iron transport protein B
MSQTSSSAPPSAQSADTQQERRTVTIALAGNPNSGKTTLFNRLTGARQQVGNYPGVTVERKEGFCEHRGTRIRVIDLPGTYSLSAYSIEEIVARQVIVDEEPDVVVDVVDASNLERNLFLATQLMELPAPLLLAFNMSDVAETRGYQFDLEGLAGLLGVDIVSTVGHKGVGVDELLDTAVRIADEGQPRPRAQVRYGRELEDEIARIEKLLEEDRPLVRRYGSRWVALKLLEDDKVVTERLEGSPAAEEAARAIPRLESVYGDHPEIITADRRYGFISGACQETVRHTVESRHNRSDQIDALLAHRIIGLPIFFALMYVVFQLTFTLGDPLMGWIETLFGWTGAQISMLWPKSADSLLRSLLVDGIIGGVGGVIVFLPNIVFLFLAIAILEDTGYMARAAFVMDHFMHKFGLHGKSFIPMLIGFGCSVPAIMATRSLENERDRLTTMLVAPLMSCGARLPIYALIIPAFFPSAWHGPMLWLIYVIGIALALVSAKLLRATLFRGDSTPFVMELPPYRMPTVHGTLIHMWGRSWHYLKKAGTIILGISIVLWVLTIFPQKETYDRDYDALMQEARTTYLAKAQQLDALFGLPPSVDALEQAVEAELLMTEAERDYWRHEEGYAEAQQQFASALEQLEASPGGGAVERFTEMRERLLEVRERFPVASEDAPAAVLSGRAAVLERLERQDPEAYGAARWFLDEMKGPYVEKVQTLEQAQSAEDIEYSVVGRIGHALKPVLAPMGFDWRIGTALVGAVAAKEVFVAQLGIVYSVGEADEGSEALRGQLHERYSPLVGFCIMLFTLISAPCMATFAIVKSESNSWKWPAAQWAGLTVLAWAATTLVYQTGRAIISLFA